MTEQSKGETLIKRRYIILRCQHDLFYTGRTEHAKNVSTPKQSLCPSATISPVATLILSLNQIGSILIFHPRWQAQKYKHKTNGILQ
jgi:hypothetical protein